jgi:hypothetical protein
MAAALPVAAYVGKERERQQLVDELDALDAEAADWMRRRRDALRRARALHDQLWPPAPRAWGRRPPRPDEPPLPPVAPDAVRLGASALRATCRQLLRIHEELSLRDLHMLLLLENYVIESRYAVKSLADAMAREVRAGLAHRVRRGVYRTVESGTTGSNVPRRPADPTLADAPPDWYPHHVRRCATSEHRSGGLGRSGDAVVGDARAADPPTELGVALAQCPLDPVPVDAEPPTEAVGSSHLDSTLAVVLVDRPGERVLDAVHVSPPPTRPASGATSAPCPPDTG